MKKISIISGIIFLLTIQLFAQNQKPERLKVSSNGHYLITENGKPFFWLGDTGWELFWRLTREEATWYIDKRKEQEFNVIQCVLLSEFEGVKKPNVYGDSIFINKSTEKPAVTIGNNPANETEYDFWDHVDYIVNYAEKQGMYLAIVPSWGEYVVPREGRLLFKTAQQAYDYGWFVGNRYKNNKNIVWMLGGDRLPDERKDGVEIWRAMAEGIADGTNGEKKFDGKADYSTTCMTHHSFLSSSKWFHHDAWLDFHSWGSYHADFYEKRSYQQATDDWNLPNPKPTLNSEPAYEMHSINWIEGNGYFMPYDVRDIAYWSVFAGACGHTYGNQCIWQFYDEKREPVTYANVHWKKAISTGGAEQLKYLKRLMDSHQMLDLKPDNFLLIGDNPSDANHIQAIRTSKYAYIYIPTGNCPKIKTGILEGTKLKATWYNPRNGETTVIGEFENKGELTFNVPGMSKEMDWLRSGRGCDWVLVLETI